MKSKLFSLFLVLGFTVAFSVSAQEKDIKLPPQATEFYEPVVQPVKPGNENHLPPADAIVLFNGSSLDAWVSEKDGGFPKWEVKDGVFTVVAKELKPKKPLVMFKFTWNGVLPVKSKEMVKAAEIQDFS